MADSFFEDQEEQSAIKADMVVAYFDAWSKIMVDRSDRIAYLDFFAGPGQFGSGQKSTPLLVLEIALRSSKLTARLATFFNDINPEYTASLEKQIAGLDGIKRMAFQPEVNTGPLSDDLVESFESMNTVPALSFVDPWGYKGLSRRLINAVLRGWGCDVVFFFNYNRINAAIPNPLVEERMMEIFGRERLLVLREEVRGMRSRNREDIVLSHLQAAIEEIGGKLLTFTFRRASGRARHFICFLTKNKLGYSIMKDIMAKRGAMDDDGVPLFEHMPGSDSGQLKLNLDRRITRLRPELLHTFAAEHVTLEEIYERHSFGTPFIRQNYRQVLAEMEEAGEVQCDRPQRSRAGTYGPNTLITFPPE